MTTKYEIAKIGNKEIRNADIKTAAWSSLSPQTKIAYQNDYNLFYKFIKKDPVDITASDVLEYIEYLEREGYENASINRKIASLSKMFRIMNLTGDISVNPISVLKEFKNISFKTSSEVRISLTLQEIKQATKITKNSTIKDRQLSLIIKMLSMTGLRISEFLNIKNSDIAEFDNLNKLIRIVGKGKKERFIYIENTFLAQIREQYPKKKDMPYLFYNRLNNRYERRSLWRDISIFFKKKIDKKVHPHMLRHFFATYKINVEKKDIKAVSKFLGHSDVSITLNAYVDTSLDMNDAKIKI